MEFNKSNPGIRFATGEQLLFFSTLRQRVDAYFEGNKLSPHANAGMVLKTILLLLAYIVPFILMVVYTPSFLISLLCWSVMGLAMAGLGMSVMHDANHGAYSSSAKVNKWVGYTLNLVGGTVLNWKYQHNVLHHTYTNIAGMDDDIDSKAILRFSPHGEKKKVHRYQWYYAFLFYSILTLYWGLLKDLVQYIQYKKAGLNRNTSKKNLIWLVRVTILKLIYFFVLLALPIWAGIPFYQVLIGFLVFHAIGGLILAIVFQMAHVVEETEFPMPAEDGAMKNSWAVHQLSTTMDFARHNKLLSWYVGGLNFQVEHHLFTRICHVHYPAISEIVKDTAQEYGVPYLEKKTLWEAFKSHVNYLKQNGAPTLEEIGG